MKKYKLLKPLPGYPVGYIFEQDSWGNISFITSVDTVVFPDFFEEIKEPSDEEVLAGWLCDIAFGGFYSRWEPIITSLTKALIAKGFDVSKLREGK